MLLLRILRGKAPFVVIYFQSASMPSFSLIQGDRHNALPHLTLPDLQRIYLIQFELDFQKEASQLEIAFLA